MWLVGVVWGWWSGLFGMWYVCKCGSCVGMCWRVDVCCVCGAGVFRVVRCGAAWHGVVRRGAVCFGVAQCDLVWRVRCGSVWFRVVLCGWFGMARCGVRRGLVNLVYGVCVVWHACAR